MIENHLKSLIFYKIANEASYNYFQNIFEICAIFSNENHPIYSIFGHLPNTICFGMLYTCLEGMHSRIRRCFLAWSGACKWYLTPFHPSCRVKRTGHDNQFIWWVFMWEQKKMNSRHSFHSSTQTLDDEVFCMIDAVSFYHWKLVN